MLPEFSHTIFPISQERNSNFFAWYDLSMSTLCGRRTVIHSGDRGWAEEICCFNHVVLTCEGNNSMVQVVNAGYHPIAFGGNRFVTGRDLPSWFVKPTVGGVQVHRTVGEFRGTGLCVGF
jgi:hypothetical protein